MKRILAGLCIGLFLVPCLFAAAPMSNKEIVLKMFNLVNRHEADAFGTVIAENFKDNGPSAGGGLEGFKKGIESMHGSFPDLHFAVESVVVDGNLVAVRGTLSGTFTGTPLFGVPATGKRGEWLSLMTFRIQDGKIVERWTSADTWGMLQQTGVLPEAKWDMSAMAVKDPISEKLASRNKKAAQAFVETIWINRKLDKVDKFFLKGGGVAAGTPAGGGMQLSPAVIKMVGGSVFQAFPDFKASIDYVMAEGNQVVLRISESGIHTTDYMGVPATNKKITWSDTFYLTYADGKIVTAWLQSDQLGLMRQIGAFKPQASAGTPAAGLTIAQRNEMLFRKFIEEFWNQRKFVLADELIAPEHFSSSIPTLPKGPEGMKIIAGVVAGKIFPDLQRRIIQIFATDTMVGAIWENSGTHKGTYMNIPATGKKVKWLELGIAKMKDGKIVESWYRPDEVGLCKELAPKKLEWLHF